MLRFVTVSAIVLACLSATSVAAQTADASLATSEPVASTDADADSQKVICRRVAPPTGTRLSSRSRQQLCMTKSDWDIMAAEAQAEARANNDPTRNREFLGGESTSSPSRSR